MFFALNFVPYRIKTYLDGHEKTNPPAEPRHGVVPVGTRSRACACGRSLRDGGSRSAAGQSVAQISTKIPNPFIAGMVYWLFLILVVGICVAGTGILAILIEIKVIELYKKNCWDVITLLMILTSTAVIIYFGEAIKKALSVNLLLLFVLSQGVYLGIRCYLKNRLGTKQYW